MSFSRVLLGRFNPARILGVLFAGLLVAVPGPAQSVNYARFRPCSPPGCEAVLSTTFGTLLASDGTRFEIDLGVTSEGLAPTIDTISMNVLTTTTSSLLPYMLLFVGSPGNWIYVDGVTLLPTGFNYQFDLPPNTRCDRVAFEFHDIAQLAAMRASALRVDGPRDHRHLWIDRYSWYGRPTYTGTRELYLVQSRAPDDDLVILFASIGMNLINPPITSPGWLGGLNLDPSAMFSIASFTYPTPITTPAAYQVLFGHRPNLVGIDVHVQSLVVDVLPASLEILWSNPVTCTL